MYFNVVSMKCYDTMLKSRKRPCNTRQFYSLYLVIIRDVIFTTISVYILGECLLQRKIMRYSGNKNSKLTQITILMKLIPSMEKIKPHLKRILKNANKVLRDQSKVQFSIIGYGGQGVRFYPHVQTGNGKVFTNLDGALKAIDSSPFTGKEISDRYLIFYLFLNFSFFRKVSQF